MDELIDWHEVHRLVGVSRATIWRWSRTGQFPAPRQVGPNRVKWLKSEVSQWIDSRPSARGTGDG